MVFRTDMVLTVKAIASATGLARPRSSSIDVVRTVGIIAIVAGHVWDSPAVRDSLYTWHVPLFFFLSGWLWTPSRTVPEEVRRRSSSLLKPYAFWGALLVVPYIIYTVAAGDVSPRTLIAPFYGGATAGRPFTTFWFVFALFATAVLWRVLERFPMYAKLAVVAGGLIAAPLIGKLLSLTPLAIGAAIPCLFFVAAGELLRKVRVESRSRRFILAFALLGLGAVLVASGLSRPLDIKGGDWGTPVISPVNAVLISWGMVLLADVCLRPNRGGAAFTWFAMAGFTVVLIHPAVLWVLPPAIPSWITFAAAILLPLLIGRLALHTRMSQWATGVPRLAAKSGSR